MRPAGCTCWYCVLRISRPCLCRYSSLDQPGIDSFRLSRQPPPCLSGRSTFFYLPLPRALPPFFFPILLPISPLLHRGGAELYLCLVAHILPRRSKRLFYTRKKTPSNHPSVPPCPSFWPRLTCPHLASSAKLPVLLDNQAGQPLTRPGSHLLFCLLRHPFTGRLHASLRASSASIIDNPLLFLTHTQSKTLAAPRDPFKHLRAFSLGARCPADPGKAGRSVNRHI